MGAVDDSFAALLHEEIVSTLINSGVDQAETLADAITSSMRSKYGGEAHYLNSADKKRRNQEIISAFRSGQERKRIAGRYNIHVTTVCRVITKHLQNNKQKDTGFGSSEWNL